MRVGILMFAHESNTFVRQPTTLAHFEGDTLLEGAAIQERFEGAHHEVGGFFQALADASTEIVPIFAARALPAGAIAADTFQGLVERMLHALRSAGQLDGLLVAPHGAMVSESHLDADGHWLGEVRREVGDLVPIVGTLDCHANLSPAMVASCDALVAYRSNPHLDQRERGVEAAGILLQTLRGEVRPAMRAAFPPVTINIERQMTSEPHLAPLYQLADTQLQQSKIISNSILLGFPYADVPEMGAAAITVSDDSDVLAETAVQELGDWLITHRHACVGQLTSVTEALDRCAELDERVCLLDMGDNVGGGSAADGTWLFAEIHRQRLADTFVCLFDPLAVVEAASAGVGKEVELRVGGKSDDLHGPSVPVRGRVESILDGRFSEKQVRHGGMREFDQGQTVVMRTDYGSTVMLTSKRMVPFSLQQLIGCGVDPRQFQILVAKGVNAPVAAYREVCSQMIRVNTAGSTSADMLQLEYHNRRRPLFPFEDHGWQSGPADVLP